VYLDGTFSYCRLSFIPHTLQGANLNAQIGLTNPATCGGDVCHLNLHKTFAMSVSFRASDTLTLIILFLAPMVVEVPALGLYLSYGSVVVTN
jgi:hypothetical protein